MIGVLRRDLENAEKLLDIERFRQQYGDGREVLARAQITLTEITATLDGPALLFVLVALYLIAKFRSPFVVLATDCLFQVTPQAN